MAAMPAARARAAMAGPPSIPVSAPVRGNVSAGAGSVTGAGSGSGAGAVVSAGSSCVEHTAVATGHHRAPSVWAPGYLRPGEPGWGDADASSVADRTALWYGRAR